MSRVAKKPISLPTGVSASIEGQMITVKGTKTAMKLAVHPTVRVVQEDKVLKIQPCSTTSEHWAMAGTMRALINNLVVGVNTGFEKRLQLVGVGYRAQAQGPTLNLSLGFSHPVEFKAPEGITIETPSQTEIIIKGADKQMVGQVAAKIRAYRPPEPYKGKGIRYANETIAIKEAKKK